MLGQAWVRYTLALALVGLALAARFAMLPLNGGLAFNTFYPSIITSALLLGIGPGVLASALGGFCAVYFFLPSFPAIGYDVSIGFYLLTCSLTCWMAKWLRSAVIQLRGGDRKLRALYETANVGIVLTDMNRRYVDFNETFRRFTGYGADELRALEYRALTIESDWAGTDEQLELAKRTGQFGPYEKEYIRKDGSRIPLRFNGALFTADDGQNYLWSIVDDITERRRLEGVLMNSISAEQHKLGRDLHDGLAQELAGISMLATAIASSIKKSGRPEAGELENLAGVATRALANCRAIAHGLSPVTYADGGIVEVLEEMVRLNRDSFGIEGSCEVTRAAPIRLGPDALDNLYRISQEAVANARRHGRAKSIKLTLHIQPTLVRLDILDDGVGMPPLITQSTGMGLKIMKYRASKIGARLAIVPGSHGGTLVSVICPQLA
ncbi:MAG TPA: PAS domain S-box protein [Steroidobacteraceae bacterium]|nr:PAS domain S-box protein [Steroidobacteraceae bacterium]